MKIDLDGQPVIDTPYGTNAAGFTIHGAIHEARDDAQCVMHLHTLDGSAVATMEEGLMPLNQTTMLIREDVAYHEYEGVALNLDERTRLVADLGEKNLMMLWNHGTLSLGRNVGEAFARMYLLERACSMQVRGLSGGSGLHMPSAEAIATTAAQGRAAMDMGVGDLLWPALLRRLDKTDASFRD
ncbi:MAG: ribulose-5-phosphate 4-epimerase/fuculose-1-phosphate aldolase [Myxococcota bacterium]